VKVNDVTFVAVLWRFRIGGPEHEVSHPHVTVTDCVETGSKGIGRTAKLDQQLKCEDFTFYWNLQSVCHGFRLTKRDYYFWVDFDHF
jgi:hypothetical protein